MKITTILTSYNRQNYIRQSIESVLNQEYTNFELLVMDDGSDFDINSLVRSYDNLKIKLTVFKPTIQERKSSLRMCKNINHAIDISTGDVFTYLADDDYYLPGWFQTIVNYFNGNPQMMIVYGILKSVGAPFADRFPETLPSVVAVLDHNQVVHRRQILNSIQKPYWPEDLGSFLAPDGFFFNKFFGKFEFGKVCWDAAVKRYHPKNLLSFRDDYLSGNETIKIRE